MYATLQEAITAAKNNGTIRLSEDTATEGVKAEEGSEFVLDLNGHALTITHPGAGSPGTETNGMQLLKDSTILIKNGSITFDDPKIKIGIQNYSNLTLNNVQLFGGEAVQYVLSDNFGATRLQNNTSITPTGDNVAFDVWYGMFPQYDDGVSVTIADETVQINGRIEFGMAKRANEDYFTERAYLQIPYNMPEPDITVLTPECEWEYTLAENYKRFVHTWRSIPTEETNS